MTMANIAQVVPGGDACPNCGWTPPWHAGGCPRLTSKVRTAYSATNAEPGFDAVAAWKDAAEITRLRRVVDDTARNWTEDATHENGGYLCRCTTCGHTFIGHKRRIRCKLCALPDAGAVPGCTTECAKIRTDYAIAEIALRKAHEELITLREERDNAVASLHADADAEAVRLSDDERAAFDMFDKSVAFGMLAPFRPEHDAWAVIRDVWHRLMARKQEEETTDNG